MLSDQFKMSNELFEKYFLAASYIATKPKLSRRLSTFFQKMSFLLIFTVSENFDE